MAKPVPVNPRRSIVRELCTRGTFVTLGLKNQKLDMSPRIGVVRRFDRRSNECLVQWGATGMVDSMVKGGLNDDLLREHGMASAHHFTTLRLANGDEIGERV